LRCDDRKKAQGISGRLNGDLMELLPENGLHDLLPDYPRPQLRRAEWTRLDGYWEFAIDRTATLKHDEVVWSARILVPFAPETTASEIENTGFYRAVWYRRGFDLPKIKASERLVLHFAAVDYAAKVWLNGVQVCKHEGGYTPFSVDITDFLVGEGAAKYCRTCRRRSIGS
jgi:beta-galactosidase/beta-glucuronidase